MEPRCLGIVCFHLLFILGFFVLPSQSFSIQSSASISPLRHLHQTPSPRFLFRSSHIAPKTPTVTVTPPLHLKSEDSEDDADASWFHRMDFPLLDLTPSILEEIRLDATLASIYILSRFFIYDITTGIKNVPGWQLQDWITLANVTSSCIVLSSLWTAVGLAMGIFVPRDSEEPKNKKDEWFEYVRVSGTAFVVGPIWTSVEIWNQWPPNDMGLWDLTSGAEGMAGWDAIATGTLGLACIMLLGKTVASDLRY